MNIFDIYLDKIKKLVAALNKEKEIEIPPIVEVITLDEFENEKAFLWRLAC